MAPPSKKRKHHHPVGGGKAKRNKADDGRRRSRVGDAGSLAWRTLGEEEFGGLQVVEGVEVVRDGSGRVSFVVAGGDGCDGEEPFEGFGSDDDGGGRVAAGEADASGARGREGRGRKQDGKRETTRPASDDTNGEAERTSQGDRKTARKEGKKEDKKKDKKTERRTGAQTNSFDALTNIDDDDDTDLDLQSWAALGLSPAIVSAIGKLGFERPTAIQERSIPPILAGDDVIGKAQTGSGKTLAFGIPIVERWLELSRGTRAESGADDDDDDDDDDDATHRRQRKGAPTAVILSPTRELAKQIGDHIRALCGGLVASASASAAPYVCVVTGGLSIQKQQRQLARADVVVGTPGRLWEVLDGDAALQGAFSRIRFLVVDEADRLFKVGQFKEAELIIGALDRRDPEADSDDDDDDDDDDDEDDGRQCTRGNGSTKRLPPRQTLVFSATFDKDLQTKLAGKRRSSAQDATDEEKMAYLMKCLRFRTPPKFIDVNPVSQMAQGLREGLIECGAMEKDLYLYTLLLLNPGRRTLVFANSISAVRRLAPFLQNLGLASVHPLHSQMAQKARLRALERFAAASTTSTTTKNNTSTSTANAGAVLVATDVAARGLDIPGGVDVVVHYHVPRTADAYVHRSGRTARGDSVGVSVMLCAPDEVLPTRRLAGKVHAERQRRGGGGGGGGGARQRGRAEMETLSVDQRVVARLRPRAALAKRLADAVIAGERAHSEDTWLRGAAADLGVEYDSDEFGGGGGGGKSKKRRGDDEGSGSKGGRATMSRAEMRALRAELREDLARRVNLGVSERYIAGGRVDMAKLLRDRAAGGGGGGGGGGDGLFLGGGDDFLGLGLGVA